MAELKTDFYEWVMDNGWNEADLQKAYKKVKARRNLYAFLCCCVPFASVFFIAFWQRSAYLAKAIKHRDFNVNASIFLTLIYVINCICIFPYFIMKSICKTNFGMGINNI